MKKEYPRFYGMMPILATPLDENGNVDTESIVSQVEYCIKADCKAIGNLAGASEYQFLSRKERETVLKTTVEATAGRVPVFIGTADYNLPDTIYNTQLAEANGADMIMLCSPPAGYASAPEIFDYYEKVCGSVKLPIIVQDTGASSAVFTPEYLVKLYNEIENISYVKAEGGNWLVKLHDLMQIVPDGLQVIGGAAGKNMMQMLRLGVTGFMCGTEAQEIHNAVVQAYLGGDEAKARHLYFTTLLPYLELYTSTSFHTSLKHMLKRRGIIKTESLIFPGREPYNQSDYIISELDHILDLIDNNEI